MLCQYCNHNDAAYHFVVRSELGSRNIHLCPACAEKLGRQYYAYLRDSASAGPWTMPDGAWSASPLQTPGEDRIPAADPDFTRRRTLAQLEARLQEAVDKEEYEQAAQLRDQIRKLQEDSVTRIPIN